MDKFLCTKIIENNGGLLENYSQDPDDLRRVMGFVKLGWLKIRYSFDGRESLVITNDGKTQLKINSSAEILEKSLDSILKLLDE